MFCGYSAAMVLGVTSEKIRIISVSSKVAMAIPASPYNRKAIMVAIAEAEILTRLLPIEPWRYWERTRVHTM